MTTIDAQGKTLGRVAAAAAKILLGKNTASFAKNVVASEEVKIINANKVVITGNKVKNKTYLRFSGYPGGLKEESLEMLRNRRGSKEIMRRAVYGMLPKNRLQDKRIKLLTIEE